MNRTYLVAMIVCGILMTGAFYLANGQRELEQPRPDPRIDTLIEQNQQMLSNQKKIMKSLDDIQEGVLQLRRRTS